MKKGLKGKGCSFIKGRKKKGVKKTTSDEKGSFVFTDLKADTYTVKVRKKGYVESKEKRFLLEGDSIGMKIELKKK